MTRQFNRHVKIRHMNVGDLVLCKNEATGKITEKGKLGANGDVPFKITHIIKRSTFELEDLEGKKLKRPWHAEHLKKYFINKLS